MSDDTRKGQNEPIEDEKLDKVSGGYVIEHNPTEGGPRNPIGSKPGPPQNPLKHPEPM